MFGTKTKPAEKNKSVPQQEDSGPGSRSCVIAAGTVIEGKIISTEDLRLDGDIIGELQSTAKVVMGTSGVIDGIAACKSSQINGKIKGELTVDGTLHLGEKANISGKIRARKLTVDSGASYSGECLIGEEHFK